MNDRQQASLDRLIASLPRDIVPPGNLWPGIAARLSGRTRRAPPMALAAAVAMAAAGLASFFTWAVLESRSVPRVIQTVAATSSLRSPATRSTYWRATRWKRRFVSGSHCSSRQLAQKLKPAWR